jgi:hypothetical protein
MHVRREKRRDPRVPVAWELRGKSLRPLDPASRAELKAGVDLRGRIADISAGGLCLLTDDDADGTGPVRCEIVVPELGVGIPTLVQVRWTHRDTVNRTNRVGLQFLV